VIAAASARHEGSAKACIEGLSERSKATGKPTHYIHVSSHPLPPIIIYSQLMTVSRRPQALL
jgi:hypothetical protein